MVRELFGAEPQTYYIDFIEPTKIPFDTRDIADFEIDILAEDIPKIMRIVAKNPSYEEFEKFIDELVKKKEESENIKDLNEKQNEYIKENDEENGMRYNNNRYQCDNGKQTKITIEDNILLYLHYNSEAALKDIMKHINKSKTRTYEIVTELIKRGLVYKIGTGKATKYALTEAGKYYIEKLFNS